MGFERPRPKELPRKLKQIRVERSLNQTDLIRALGYGGRLSPGMVSNFETGRREPSLLLLLAYARLASVSTDCLIDDSLELAEARTEKS
jgi:transcriptional regulator with XRE-family HTH domain